MGWGSKLLVATIGVGVVAAIGWYSTREYSVQRAFEQTLDQNVGVDTSGQLPDGLHVYLCGTGSPMPDPDRAGTCIGVLAGETAFVFDIGSGGARNLGSVGFPFEKIETIYLTHLHSDHIDGLGELLVLSWMDGTRAEQTPVHGPVGTKEVVEGFNAAYRLDSTYRVAHHGPEIAIPTGFG